MAISTPQEKQRILQLYQTILTDPNNAFNANAELTAGSMRALHQAAHNLAMAGTPGFALTPAQAKANLLTLLDQLVPGFTVNWTPAHLDTFLAHLARITANDAEMAAAPYVVPSTGFLGY